MARNSEIYLKAAQLVEKGSSSASCLAVAYYDSRRGFKDNAVDAYARLFAPTDYLYGFWLARSEVPYDEHKEWRLTALCFMAAIAADEEATARSHARGRP